MKVIISNRSVYHKFVETTIEVPDELEYDDIHIWLCDNEQEYVHKIFKSINQAKFKPGLGLGKGMVEEDAETEWRFDVKEDGKLTYGGHL